MEDELPNMIRIKNILLGSPINKQYFMESKSVKSTFLKSHSILTKQGDDSKKSLTEDSLPYM